MPFALTVNLREADPNWIWTHSNRWPRSSGEYAAERQSGLWRSRRLPAWYSNAGRRDEDELYADKCPGCNSRGRNQKILPHRYDLLVDKILDYTFINGAGRQMTYSHAGQIFEGTFGTPHYASVLVLEAPRWLKPGR